MTRFGVIALVLLAGCSDRPTPVAVPIAPRPVVEVAPRAEQMLRSIAADQKLAEPWWVRLSVQWRPDPFIIVELERRPPAADDYVTEANGLKIVFKRELLTYLRGSRVQFVKAENGAGFDVTFPNQDAAEREAAGRWLREQTARRKVEAEQKK